MPFLSILLLLFLLFFPGISSAGAARGLNLWFQTVIPAIAPFMICTQLILAADAVQYLAKPASVLFRKLFRTSENGSFLLLCGLLCGYPLGARLCKEFLYSHRISRSEADYLFAVSNHPSPMFLAGYLTSLLKLPSATPWFLLSFYLPLPLTAWTARKFYHYSEAAAESFPASDGQSSHSLEEIIAGVSETMILIGNYMMLCSILSAWIQNLSGLQPEVSAVLAGITEITTGSASIASVLPTAYAVPLIIGTVSFGGLSGILQTRGVTKNAGLSIRHYVLFQLLQAVLSVLCWYLLNWVTAHLPVHW